MELPAWVQALLKPHLSVNAENLDPHPPPFFVFSRATPEAYGSSQARALIGAVATGLCDSHSNAERRIRAESATYTTAHSNTGS